MASRGRGRRGGGWSNNPLPPVLDQQAFIKAIGAATATIAHASSITATIAQPSATGSQRGPSNLQRFKAHHPSTFRGGGDPMVADHWFKQVDKILEAMEITFDATRIKLASFHLKGESQVWWDIEPFEVPKRVGTIAYMLALPPNLSGVHVVFHVSMRWKYIHDPTHVVDWGNLELHDIYRFFAG